MYTTKFSWSTCFRLFSLGVHNLSLSSFLVSILIKYLWHIVWFMKQIIVCHCTTRNSCHLFIKGMLLRANKTIEFSWQGFHLLMLQINHLELLLYALHFIVCKGLFSVLIFHHLIQFTLPYLYTMIFGCFCFPTLFVLFPLSAGGSELWCFLPCSVHLWLGNGRSFLCSNSGTVRPFPLDPDHCWFELNLQY